VQRPNWLFNRTSTSFAGSRLFTRALGTATMNKDPAVCPVCTQTLEKRLEVLMDHYLTAHKRGPTVDEIREFRSPRQQGTLTNQHAEIPTLKDIATELRDTLLEPAKEPAFRRADRVLHVFFGLLIFVLASAFGLIAIAGLLRDLLEGQVPKYLGTQLAVAAGGIGGAVLGFRLVFNIRGKHQRLLPPSALWAFAVFWLSVPVIGYLWGQIIPLKPLIGTLALGGGCMALAMKRALSDREHR